MLYAITDRHLYGEDEAERRARLLEHTAVWAAHGVAFIQLREKDLSARELVELACAMRAAIRAASSETRLLINGRPDVALAAGADGVHLPSGTYTLTPAEVRAVFAGRARMPYISVACHTLQEVQAAKEQLADGILFAPVFEKPVRDSGSEKHALAGAGAPMLAEACLLAASVPVFALGGVTAENATECIQVGAAGIAAIRLLHEPAERWASLAKGSKP